MPTPWAVILTRPVGRSRALADAVRRSGHQPVALPTAAIAGPEDVDAARAGLLRARTADVVIFTSVAAVGYAAKLLPDWKPRGELLAVGPSTAQAGRRRGWSLTTPDGRYDSEALLALPALKEVAGRRVSLITAPDGRGRLQEALAARGARVDEVFVYRRRPPRWDRRHHRALIAAPARRATLASSVEALAVLARQLDPAEIATLRRGVLVAASARVAEAARTQGWRDVEIASSALPRDLLGALIRRIGDRSRRKS